MTIEVRELALPATWDEDSDAGRELRASIAVRNAVVVDTWDGDDALILTAAESLGQAQHQDDERLVFLGGWLDGEHVGRAVLSWGVHEGLHVGSASVLVHPDARSRGVGSALWEAALARLAAEGRTTIQAWIDHRPATGATIAPPTGFGAIPADAPETRFALARGFRLEQVERVSGLRLDDALDLDALEAAALPHATDYELLLWRGATPVEHRDAMAALRARMSTDAPSADLDVDEETWMPIGSCAPRLRTRRRAARCGRPSPGIGRLVRSRRTRRCRRPPSPTVPSTRRTRSCTPSIVGIGSACS